MGMLYFSFVYRITDFSTFNNRRQGGRKRHEAFPITESEMLSEGEAGLTLYPNHDNFHLNEISQGIIEFSYNRSFF